MTLMWLFPVDRLPYALNTHLPVDIMVSGAREVHEDFNAIGSCAKKEYTYVIYNNNGGEGQARAQGFDCNLDAYVKSQPELEGTSGDGVVSLPGRVVGGT